MIKHWLSGKLGYEFFQKNQQIGTYTIRTYEKNTVISLFQKLECKIFFKKQQFWIRLNFVRTSISL
ncbi:hypothetical protein LMANV2_410018 [Leptospira interrogans serovar Manilae]|uniref:Uncharacterized protein n=1 Tax=Leptospira interrogans serovar Manilae TaxID=214675 RepID=A0AAQ1P1N1_LEPIR|nr:hypothetical protein LIMLP_05705 [Leptospira interrogans serovar Manilae]AKP29267.1 hypothetical protein LIMHP_05695 [Leptospira interrogans serovar Manilae]EYU63892.1 hypothetical protein CI00_11135 [Leptospira interrogans serovar Manilae]SOR62162.1 hypothetical protein LMANV2_410018 [Leptospira interrogans serovar Manilae]